MFEVPHATNFFRVSPSNGGALLLVGTTVVGSGGVDISFWVGEDFEMLVRSIMNVVKTLSVSLMSLISAFISCLLFSIYSLMRINCYSDLFYILLTPFGILKFDI